MLELCITIIIYHNAVTLWQVHLRHCILKESLLYTGSLCILNALIVYNNYYLSQCSDSLASTPSALRPQGESFIHGFVMHS